MKAKHLISAWRNLVGYPLPPSRCLDQEKGFQGVVLHGITSFQPQKTPRGGELIPVEKETNRRITSIRIRIEPAMSGVKRSRIVKDNIRLVQDGIWDAVMDTCGGVYNLRLPYRPCYYVS